MKILPELKPIIETNNNSGWGASSSDLEKTLADFFQRQRKNPNFPTARVLRLSPGFFCSDGEKLDSPVEPVSFSGADFCLDVRPSLAQLRISCQMNGYDCANIDFSNLYVRPEARGFEEATELLVDGWQATLDTDRDGTDFILSTWGINPKWREPKVRFYELTSHLSTSLDQEMTPELEEKFVQRFDAIREFDLRKEPDSKALTGEQVLELATDLSPFISFDRRVSKDDFGFLSDLNPKLISYGLSSNFELQHAVRDLISARFIVWSTKFNDYKLYPPLRSALLKRFEKTRGGEALKAIYGYELDKITKGGRNNVDGVTFPTEQYGPKMMYYRTLLEGASGEMDFVRGIEEKRDARFKDEESARLIRPFLTRLATLPTSNPELYFVLGDQGEQIVEHSKERLAKKSSVRTKISS